MRSERPLSTMVVVALCTLLAAATAAAQRPAAAQPPAPSSSQYKVVCGHDCLTEFAERFLYGLTHHDASAVPLASWCVRP